MRGRVLLFLLINIAVVGLLLNSVWTLLSLLVVDGSGDAISRAELPAPKSDLIEGIQRVIPKIIHQTYANESIPSVWQVPQRSCIDLHADYEYMVREADPIEKCLGVVSDISQQLWTDASARDFIKIEYGVSEFMRRG